MIRCKVCGRPLKNKDSINEGVGPGCKKKLKVDNINILTLEDFGWLNKD